MDIDAYVDGYMHKQAGPISDALLGAPGAGILNMLLPGSSLGVAGFGAGKGMSEEELEEANKSSAKAILPGVGPFRTGGRLSATHRRSKEDNPDGESSTKNILTELVGPITSTATAGIAGGALGAGLGELSRASGISGAGSALKGGQIGAAIGSGAATAAHIAAAVLALKHKRRTREEQSEEDAESQAASNLLLPGVGAYGHYKRRGSTGTQKQAAEGDPPWGRPPKPQPFMEGWRNATPAVPHPPAPTEIDYGSHDDTMQERANARLKRRPGRAAKAKITRGNIAPAYEVPTSNPLKRIGRNLPAMFNDRFWNDAKAGNNPFAYKQVKR